MNTAPGRSWLFAVLIALAAVAASTSVSAARGSSVLKLEWENLVPPGFRPDKLIQEYSRKVENLGDGDPRAEKLAEELRQHWEAAPVVKSLHDKTVELSGFLVTLEGDGKHVSEFLLVPYFGACIHVPPPPSNQIVLVRTKKPYKVGQVFDMVKVTGRLKSEHARHELAAASYVIEANKVELSEE